MYTIETDQIKATIRSKGAELVSLYHKQFQLEYLWQADPAFWPKHSPVLFPIVGTLKSNTFFYKGQPYQLSRHGFARDRNFTVTDQDQQSVTLSLRSDEETLKVYPFPFVFNLTYKAEGAGLRVTYTVRNGQEKEPMLFSVGAHPAFKVPLAAGTAYGDYELLFEKTENAGRWPISREGLIETEPQPLLQNSNRLPLAKGLFQKDALVLKNLQSESLCLQSAKTNRGLQFHFKGFPYLGLWAAPGADFLCIEPWCGIADSVNADQQLQNKEGIVRLEGGGQWEKSWQVDLF